MVSVGSNNGWNICIGPKGTYREPFGELGLLQEFIHDVDQDYKLIKDRQAGRLLLYFHLKHTDTTKKKKKANAQNLILRTRHIYVVTSAIA